MDAWATIAPLYDRQEQYVSYARRIVLDPTDAEDVVHEAFMRVKGTIEGGGKIRNPNSYLKRAIRNVAVDYNTAADERKELEDDRGIEALSSFPADTEASALFNVTFNTTLDQMTHEQRAAFILCELRGLTRREAARELGITDTNLQRAYEGARRHLAKELS